MDRSQAIELVQRQANAWEQADIEAIVADFAPDGLFISPGGRWKGHEAIREAAASFFASVMDIECKVTRVLLDGDQGAAEWTWSETSRKTGKRHTTEDAIIFALRDDKIVYWREYIDKGEAAD
jgi:uncharacterized protein (TIGR02246 family)